MGSSATEDKLWRYATQRSEAIYVTGVCHGGLFQAEFAPLANDDEFFGDQVHRAAHEDHVAEVLDRFGVGAFAKLPESIQGEGYSPADWACSRRFLPEDLKVDLETIDKWVEEDYPGGVLWDYKHGLTESAPPGI
jgi:hypothetical protein